jgi:hypothetical protein
MNALLLAGAIVSGAGLAAFYYLMVPAKQSPQKRLGESFKMPDVRLHYAPETLYQTFDAAGEAGRPEMRRYWLYDFGLMTCLTAVMIAVSANVAGKGTWLFTLMVWLAALRTAVDIAEDLLFLSLLKRYPARRNGMARLAGAVTTLKHALLIAWLLPLFFKLVLTAFNIQL